MKGEKELQEESNVILFHSGIYVLKDYQDNSYNFYKYVNNIPMVKVIHT